MCLLVMVCGPYLDRCTEWLFLQLLWVEGNILLLIQLAPNHSIIMVGHTALGAMQSHLIPPPSLQGGEESPFPGSTPPDEMVNPESVVGVKPWFILV